MTPIDNPITIVEKIAARYWQPTEGAVGRAAEEPVDPGAPVPDPDLKAPVDVGVLAVDVIPPIKTPSLLLIVLKKVQLEEEGIGCAGGVTGSPW